VRGVGETAATRKTSAGRTPGGGSVLAYQSTDDAREAAKWEREQALSFAYATVATCVEVFFVVILIYSAVSSRH
jgi:hypothetical protein